MVRIIAALSLAAMLGVAAVPAVAHDLDEGLFLDKNGNFVLAGELGDLEDLAWLGLDFDEEDLTGSVGQAFEQEDVESGDVEPSVSISNSGNNANLCPTVLQSANSGNVQNAQGVVQYQSGADDIEFEGSSITIALEAAGSCDQTIRQSVAAGR